MVADTYARRDINSLQKNNKISRIRYTGYQRPGTTNDPDHLGTDVTFVLPRPQHFTKILLINIVYPPPVHSDYYLAFRVMVAIFCLFALGVVADVC